MLEESKVYKPFTCVLCVTSKDSSEFSRNPSAKRGHDLKCMACRNRLRRGNREVEGRKYVLKQYGLTVEEYKEMLSSQKGCCAICTVHEDTQKTNLHVDHCHTTGKVRGLLCTKCNAGLGMFNDDTSNLTEAIHYLRAIL
jgi:hypothetical protein